MKEINNIYDLCSLLEGFHSKVEKKYEKFKIECKTKLGSRYTESFFPEEKTFMFIKVSENCEKVFNNEEYIRTIDALKTEGVDVDDSLLRLLRMEYESKKRVFQFSCSLELSKNIFLFDLASLNDITIKNFKNNDKYIIPNFEMEMLLSRVENISNYSELKELIYDLKSTDEYLTAKRVEKVNQILRDN